MKKWATRSCLAAATLGLLVPMAEAGAATTNSWPMAGYNAARSNLNPVETTLTASTLPGLRYQRTITLPAPGEDCGALGTPPVVSGTTLYTTAGPDLVAYSLTSGAQLWRTTLDALDITVYNSLVVSGDRVYVAGNDCISQSDPAGQYWVVNAATGAQIAHPDHYGPIDSLVVSGSRMILSGSNVNDGTAYFAGYDTATLTRLWGNDTCVPDPLLVVGGAVVATCPTAGATRSLGAYSLADGRRLWSKPGNWRPSRGDTDATTATGLFAFNPAGYLTSLVPATGAISWRSSTERGALLAVGKKRLYVKCDGTALCALNRANGLRLWKKPAGARAVAAVTVAADVVYPAPANSPVLASTGANVVVGVGYPGREAGVRVIVASGMVIATNLTARTIKIYGL